MTVNNSSAVSATPSLHPTGSWIVRIYLFPPIPYPNLQTIHFFFKELPKDITLDGELYGGRGEFQSTVSIVKTVNSVHWKNITFQAS